MNTIAALVRQAAQSWRNFMRYRPVCIVMHLPLAGCGGGARTSLLSSEIAPSSTAGYLTAYYLRATPPYDGWSLLLCGGINYDDSSRTVRRATPFVNTDFDPAFGTTAGIVSDGAGDLVFNVASRSVAVYVSRP